MTNENEIDWSDIERAGHEKPIGISILTWLHLIGGILVAAVVIYALVNRADLARNVKEAEFSPFDVLLSLVFIGILGVGSGIGMLLEKTWGWWFAVYYYFNSILRNSFTCYMVSQVADQIDLEGGLGPKYYYFKYGARVVVHCLLFLYLFKPNVLVFFQLGAVNKGKIIGTLITLSLAQIAIATFL